MEDVEQGGYEGEELEGDENNCYRQRVPDAAHPFEGRLAPEAWVAMCSDPAVSPVCLRIAATGQLLPPP